MPIYKKMMKSVKKTYGAKKGKNVYYAIETKKNKKSKPKK